MVYDFEMWVMAHSVGIDVVLGTDFMIPAGIRLDLFHGAAQLPTEVRIPLIKTKNMVIVWSTAHTEGHPISDAVSPWPAGIVLTNVSERTAYVSVFDKLAMLVSIGDLSRGEGYVRLDSKNYKDWQVLAYENCRDRQLFKRGVRTLRTMAGDPTSIG
ncbi:hypothetical protein F441_21295 [Phytophthora nicotianae CJ01A1]|uniref:Uncharacterized protein n=1 Tax=Phytophthora nicotianae CJ01A1 TaxID=1317063 RepID=W2VT41_PHYNI|nr:hypothetical protein F441_21295 [Phytophthora nicotianae CJ01A1]